MDETTYGIIKEIRAPNPSQITSEQKTSVSKSRQKPSKKTCRESTRHKNNRSKTDQPTTSGHTTSGRGKRARTLSESRQASFGIQAPPVVPRSSRRNRTNINYLALNDGLEDEEVSSPRRKKKLTYRPGSGPSATRQAANKHTISSEATTTDTNKTKASLPAVPPLPAIPGTSQSEPNQTNVPLTGVPATSDEHLPDLVLPQDDPDTSKATGAISTEEDIEAAETLLSLGEVRDDTLDDDDENAMLMPIGGPNITADVAPEPIRLDQVNVDKAIAELIQKDQDDENDQTDQADKNKNETPTADADRDDTVDAKPKSAGRSSEPVTRGKLKTKTYALKKKVETRKRTFQM